MQAPESRLFSFRSEFHQAVLEVLMRSRHSLALRDNDFSDWPIESPEAIGQLSRLLKSPGARLRLVVHAPDWLEKHGTRFAQLRRSCAGNIECRQAPSSIAAGEGLLIGDNVHLLRRAHYQAFRGRLMLAMPQEVEAWRHKYETLWEESVPCLTATTTGL